MSSMVTDARWVSRTDGGMVVGDRYDELLTTSWTSMTVNVTSGGCFSGSLVMMSRHCESQITVFQGIWGRRVQSQWGDESSACAVLRRVLPLTNEPSKKTRRVEIWGRMQFIISSSKYRPKR